MTASQPLFCFKVNLTLDTRAGSIHDVVGSYACKATVDKLPVSDRTKGELKAGCNVVKGGIGGAAQAFFTSSEIGGEHPNRVSELSRGQEKADHASALSNSC